MILDFPNSKVFSSDLEDVKRLPWLLVLNT